MLCYRDRTFCDFESCGKYSECFTAVTQADRINAEKIGLPICFYADKPDCYQGAENEME